MRTEPVRAARTREADLGAPEQRGIEEKTPVEMEPEATPEQAGRRTKVRRSTRRRDDRAPAKRDFDQRVFREEPTPPRFRQPPKALLRRSRKRSTNSLDACEEAGFLPDLLVEIREIAEKPLRVVVGDSVRGSSRRRSRRSSESSSTGRSFTCSNRREVSRDRDIGRVMYSQLTTENRRGIPAHRGASVQF